MPVPRTKEWRLLLWLPTMVKLVVNRRRFTYRSKIFSLSSFVVETAIVEKGRRREKGEIENEDSLAAAKGDETTLVQKSRRRCF